MQSLKYCINCPTYINLFVGFKTEQTTNLVRRGVNNTCAHKVVWVRINAVQRTHTKANQLQEICQVNINDQTREL